MRGIDIETKRKLCEMGAGTLLNPEGLLRVELTKLTVGTTEADVVLADALRAVLVHSPMTSLQRRRVSARP